MVVATNATLERLVQLDKRVDGAENDGIQARWEFGRELLKERKGKLLPGGRLDEICTATGKSREELQCRMRFAERYPTKEELRNAVTQFRSWHGIVNEALASVHFSSESDAWNTPQDIVGRVVRVFGEIDLDPCANEGEPSVPAKAHFQQKDEGLTRSWHGRVYMNPPYGREIADWIDKLVSEYDSGNISQAIALVPARTDTDWWYGLRDSTVCFIRNRLRFSGHKNSAPFPSAAAYLGSNSTVFARVFDELGDLWVRLR